MLWVWFVQAIKYSSIKFRTPRVAKGYLASLLINASAAIVVNPTTQNSWNINNHDIRQTKYCIKRKGNNLQQYWNSKVTRKCACMWCCWLPKLLRYGCPQFLVANSEFSLPNVNMWYDQFFFLKKENLWGP